MIGRLFRGNLFLHRREFTSNNKIIRQFRYRYGWNNVISPIPIRYSSSTSSGGNAVGSILFRTGLNWLRKIGRVVQSFGRPFYNARNLHRLRVINNAKTFKLFVDPIQMRLK